MDLKKQLEGLSIGFIWIRIWTQGRLWWLWPLGFITCEGFFTEQAVLASQKGLISMK